MKKAAAILLTGCLTFQMIMGTIVPAGATEFFHDEEVLTEISGNTEETNYLQEETSETIAQDSEAEDTSLPEQQANVTEELSESDFSEFSGEPESAENESVENIEIFGSGEEELFFDQESIYPAFSDTTSTSQTGSGAIDVRLISALPFQKSTNVSIFIKSGETIIHSDILTIQNGDTGVKGITFSNLPAGVYTVELSADGFAAYRQDITVSNGFSSKIQVYSAQTWPDSQINHPGILFIGDVDGDKDVDTTDKDLMVAAIRSESTDIAYDLNGDGIVNLSDLQYLACNLNKKPVHSTVETAINPENIIASPEENTILSGSASSLLIEEGSVSLRPASGGKITKDTPVSLNFTLSEEQTSAPPVSALVIQAPVTLEDDTTTNAIASALVTVTYFDEAEQAEKDMTIPIAFDTIIENNPVPAAFSADFVPSQPAASVYIGSDGSMVIDLGKQIAVKKVSIRITGTTRKEDTLVNITKVEFLNGMENHIPEPELNIPANVSAQAFDKEFTVSWSAQPNVTGYEVRVSGVGKGSNTAETQIIRNTETSLNIKSINSRKLVNNTEYQVCVRSINGDWKSPWSETVIVVPKASRPPEAPDYVHVEGGYRYVKVSWKAMDDTDSYTVYYKEKNTSSFQAAGKTEKTSIMIDGLKDDAVYEVYVVGTNEIGNSPESAHSEAVTKSEVPRLPAYKLINTSNGFGTLTNHIENIRINRGSMYESALDISGTGFGLADDSYDSFWEYKNWDAGGFNNTGSAINVTFDDIYDINYITFTAAPMNSKFMYLRLTYVDKNNSVQSANARLDKLADSSGNTYYRIKLAKHIQAKEIRLGLGIDYYTKPWVMQIGEMRFYHYDSLEDDILNLYTDESYTTLKENVTEEILLDLENRLNTKDPVSQELHPEYGSLKTELERARGIFEGNLEKAISIDPTITSAKDSSIGFTGLNAWQPLGRTAAAGETLIIYVGNNGQKVGTASSLNLIATQYHSEVNNLLNVYNLKIGRNEITLGALNSMTDTEKGGPLYIAYTGNNANDRYVVRVSGGAAIPVLNISGLNDKERSAAIHTYIEELEVHVSRLEEMHAQYCQHSSSLNHGVTYDAQNCILNTTDILLDQMMYSVPATQIWNSLRGNTISEKAQNLDKAFAAMDDTMTLFYQHKGLSNEKGDKNSLPSRHLNIRYMRMFKGAFMYAAGNHIGIEWAEVPILASASDASDFGWGIAHEIGHNINQNSYAVAEVTNNYFAQLLTGQVRYHMDDVYKKVTSGASGSSDNVFTSLAMYWQLHLAYDNSSNDHQIYNTYDDQFNNLYFARVDTYSRNPGAAPNGLKLGSDAQQNIMRLSCAAAGKNLLPFFKRWGLEPDGATEAYASSFSATEERALYYADNTVRDYRIQNHSSETALTIRDQNIVTASSAVSAEAANQIRITITANSHQDSILGYEVIRVMTSNGTVQERVIGFVPYAGDETVYTDTVTTVNNRVMSYKVRAVDKFLYYSNTANAGFQKIATKGNHDKTQWTVTTANLTSTDDVAIAPNQENPDNGTDLTGNTEKIYRSVDRIIDNDMSTIYTGTASTNGQIIVDMHQTFPCTSVIYYGDSANNLEFYGSTDGKEWRMLKARVSVQNGDTVWFNPQNPYGAYRWVGTYDIRYLKLMFPSGKISIKELEICGPSGDNLEFLTTGDTPAVGILEKDYPVGNDTQGNPQIIPKGSLIVTGYYKGNPAYNVVLVYDGDGNILGARKTESETTVSAEQVIFAPDPENGQLGEVSEGTWVYYLEPDNWTAEDLPKEIRAELFRVDNAFTNKNERVVSDTQILTVPEELPFITLTGGIQK